MFTAWLGAQQIQVNSLYNMNLYEINPASAGKGDMIPLIFSYRKSWTGVPGSPTDQKLATHLKLHPTMAGGLKFFNSVQGPLRKTGMEATYAYHFDFNSNDSKLAFGLSGLFYQYFIDKNNLNPEDPNDMVLLGAEQKWLPDAAFGAMYYSHDYYLGLSVYQLFQGRVRLDAQNIADYRQVRHYYFTSGYNVFISDKFTLMPSLLFKLIETGTWQTDIQMVLSFQDMVSLGLTYRSGNAMVFQLGYRNDRISLGYAYDLGLSDISNISSGSHEILLSYSFDSIIK